MSELQKCNFGEEFAPWQTGAAFSAYWSYTFINNSMFYAMVPAYYRPFMQRMVQKWGWWNDGWVPYFHNQDKGILSTRLASSLVQKITRKVVGSRVMFKNVGNQEDKTGANETRTLMSKWANKTNFEKTIKVACKYACAMGTSLIKINKNSDGRLWTEAVRFDRFVPTIDASTGKLREVKCFLMTEIDYGKGTDAVSDFTQVYNLVEHRYFGDYKSLDGKEYKDIALVDYQVYKATGTISQGSFAMLPNQGTETIPWKTLPKKVQASIRENYGTILLGIAKPLPFTTLGAELLTWTTEVNGYPQLPFGESVLENIMPLLMEYDYMISSMGTDMYLGRGRVMLPAGIESPNQSNGLASNWNSGYDSMMFVKIPYVNPEDQSPTPLQFSLRSEEWAKLRNTIIESIAVNIGLSPSTIASFLNDSSARTAREISTEENETAAYVADTRAIIETPINCIIDEIRLFMGLKDEVEVRWSQSGLTNSYITTEMMVQQYQNGLISLKDAITNLNPDDDEEQILLKVASARADFEKKTSLSQPFDESQYFKGS